ncbi:uracil-DNA glycosylase family protein [Roseomonas haemaphysalidis]|uniref:Uracil-DNA glycosylase-like domain-containing protein n=1 Tax=Roseomonas haemaphysalidis TaxID=2768162 RepID=A0ABS3KW19_9PROT|nr:uracil-DNA glycosylase family protein [Roseomonas haemaphysalidis]MBO1081675.1 hypothetical protein [Roseomonas haemaphysalidis]
MDALLSEVTYSHLLELFDGNGGSSACGDVMMPVGACRGEGPRVLFVGQAIGGGPEAPMRSAEEAHARFEGYANLIGSARPFWRFIRKTLEGALHRRTGKAASLGQLAEHYGWTNLALIGSPLPSSNPDGELLERQVSACRDALREAVETMRPTSIVLLSNEYASQIRSAITGSPEQGRRRVDPLVRSLDVIDGVVDIPIYWTKHPGWLNRNGLFEPVSARLAQEL